MGGGPHHVEFPLQHSGSRRALLVAGSQQAANARRILICLISLFAILLTVCLDGSSVCMCRLCSYFPLCARLANRSRACPGVASPLYSQAGDPTRCGSERRSALFFPRRQAGCWQREAEGSLPRPPAGSSAAPAAPCPKQAPISYNLDLQRIAAQQIRQRCLHRIVVFFTLWAAAG